MLKKLKTSSSRIVMTIVGYFKKMGTFSLGVFVGTVYGSVVATLTCWTMLAAL